MSKVNFSNIAANYEEHSQVQKSAADTLLKLLEVESSADVLDLGCGVGNLTRKVKGITKGKVVGIDSSEGMIREAVEKSKGLAISFEIKSAEELDYKNCFDVILCNSAFQWFKNVQKAIRNCHAALRRGGKIGIQTPAKNCYSPNFIEAIGKVKEDSRTRNIFAHFNTPWFSLETAEEYRELFQRCGFRVTLSRIENITTEHTSEEVFNIFSSAAAAAYLNQDCYNAEIGADYIDSFREIAKDAFVQQANTRGKVELIFNRIFLVAIKE